MNILYFFSIMRSKCYYTIKTQFFRPVIIFWNIAFPIGWFLQFYFQYLPFGASTVFDSFFGITFTIPLIDYTLTGQFVWLLFVNSGIYAGIFFLYERFENTLEPLLMSPAPRLALMLGMAFGS